MELWKEVSGREAADGVRLLPLLPKGETHRRVVGQVRFGGLRTGGAKAEDMVSMRGLAPDAEGRLKTRAPRGLYQPSRGGAPHGLTRHGNELLFVQGETLYASSGVMTVRAVGSVSDSDKVFASVGERLFILPDKLVYESDTRRLLPAEPDTGLLTGVTLEGASLTAASCDFEAAGFRPGDGIELTVHGHWMASLLNGVYRVRDVLHDKLLIEGAFPQDGTFDLSLRRPFPAAVGICTVGGRVWGCDGRNVYASEEGNPFNWCCPRADAPEKGPVTLPAGSDGVFTACRAWQGSPCFFMPDRIFRVVGRTASSFTLDERAVPGVTSENRASLCEVNGVLYYVGDSGVYAWTGGLPERLGGPFTDPLRAACGGTDGRVYYLSADSPDGGVTYLYDPLSGGWYLEDGRRMAGMTPAVALPRNSDPAWTSGTLCLMQEDDGRIWTSRSFGAAFTGGFTEEDLDGKLTAEAQLSDERSGEPEGVRLLSVSLRACGETGGSLTLSYRREGADAWETLALLSGSGREEMYRVPVRADVCAWFSLRLSFVGSWCVAGLWKTLEDAGQ